MIINVEEPINRTKWLGYLGVLDGGSRKLNNQLDEADKLLKDTANIQAIYKVMNIEDVKMEGFSIAKHLEGCMQVAVMAVTLGIGVDNLLRQKQITDMALAVILDCGASLLIEQACDIYEQVIRNEVSGHTTSRFSPGYGDYPLEYQQNVIQYVDGPRKIGLNVTENHLMIPRKSVTALIGIADHPVTGRLATCGECILRKKCTLRSEGKHCGDRF